MVFFFTVWTNLIINRQFRRASVVLYYQLVCVASFKQFQSNLCVIVDRFNLCILQLSEAARSSTWSMDQKSSLIYHTTDNAPIFENKICSIGGSSRPVSNALPSKIKNLIIRESSDDLKLTLYYVWLETVVFSSSIIYISNSFQCRNSCNVTCCCGLWKKSFWKLIRLIRMSLLGAFPLFKLVAEDHWLTVCSGAFSKSVVLSTEQSWLSASYMDLLTRTIISVTSFLWRLVVENVWHRDMCWNALVLLFPPSPAHDY